MRRQPTYPGYPPWMKRDSERCPECGTDWSAGLTCTRHFHQMGAWELDNQLYAVHHLMVLSYHLQHPSLYSPQTLNDAKQMLAQFLEGGVTPQQMRQRIARAADSSVRAHKITGTPDSHGEYPHAVMWTMTAADVTAGGVENFYANVREWAASILASLRQAGEVA